MSKRKPVLGAPLPGQSRRPAFGNEVPFESRTPAAGARLSLDGTPAFRFHRMDFNGPFSWDNCNKIDWLYILNQLGSLEKLNRSQLAQQGSHDYLIEKCSKLARDRFMALKLDVHYESVFSIRLEGKLRVICIDMWPVLELLWLDSNHQVYPSRLKHT